MFNHYTDPVSLTDIQGIVLQAKAVIACRAITRDNTFSFTALAELIGPGKFDERHAELCRKLISPNGWFIYAMLKARMEND